MRNIILTILFATVALTASAQNPSSSVDRPKLVVGIVVDQMRWDYLYRYADLYCEGGLKRLMREGTNFEQLQINYIPSVTAVGHASVYTGAVPSIHGIAGNDFLIGKQKVYCTEDQSVSGVGSDTPAGKMSPKNMLSNTIGDELKIATNFQSRVVGVALKDRGAILPAGHHADAAYWFDYEASCFISSTYYMTELPAWLRAYNNKVGVQDKEQVQYSPLGNELTAELAKAAIAGEQLGQRGETDMLTISFSCTDIIGHRYATHHAKTQEIYVDLDQRLADLFNYLDQTIGKDEYLVFLTADHGAANNVTMLQEHGSNVTGFFSVPFRKELDTFIMEHYALSSSPVIALKNYKIHLDHAMLDSLGLDLDEVKATTIKWLKRDPQFSYVVDLERASEASIPAPIKEKIINGYHRMRSGDIQMITNPGNYDVYAKVDPGTTHGMWNTYDCHLPFLVMGHNVPAQTSQRACTINDIAATICALIHVQMPSGCIGSPLIE